MPRGYPNPKQPSVAPATTMATAPAPMMLIEPGADGAIRLNAYGLDAAEMVDVLRRSLLHLVATQAGVQVISLEVPRAAAVVASRAPSKPTSAPKRPQPSRNGRSAPARLPVRAEDDWAEEDVEEDE